MLVTLISLNWKDLIAIKDHSFENSQMSTHMPEFQSFSSIFAWFCTGKISHQQHKGSEQKGQEVGLVSSTGSVCRTIIKSLAHLRSVCRTEGEKLHKHADKQGSTTGSCVIIWASTYWTVDGDMKASVDDLGSILQPLRTVLPSFVEWWHYLLQSIYWSMWPCYIYNYKHRVKWLSLISKSFW